MKKIGASIYGGSLGEPKATIIVNGVGSYKWEKKLGNKLVITPYIEEQIIDEAHWTVFNSISPDPNAYYPDPLTPSYYISDDSMIPREYVDSSDLIININFETKKIQEMSWSLNIRGLNAPEMRAFCNNVEMENFGNFFDMGNGVLSPPVTFRLENIPSEYRVKRWVIKRYHFNDIVLQEGGNVYSPSVIELAYQTNGITVEFEENI